METHGLPFRGHSRSNGVPALLERAQCVRHARIVIAPGPGVPACPRRHARPTPPHCERHAPQSARFPLNRVELQSVLPLWRVPRSATQSDPLDSDAAIAAGRRAQQLGRRPRLRALLHSSGWISKAVTPCFLQKFLTDLGML